MHPDVHDHTRFLRCCKVSIFASILLTLGFYVGSFVPEKPNTLILSHHNSVPQGHQPKTPPAQGYYVIGMATVGRPTSGIAYNLDTLRNVINSLNCALGNSTNSGHDARNIGKTTFCMPRWRDHVKIVVYNAEYNPEAFAATASAIHTRYSDYIASGNLILVNRSQSDQFRQPLYFTYPLNDTRRDSGRGDAESEDVRRRCARPGEWWYEYPLSKRLKLNWGDPLPQVLWRAKQLMDTVFVLHYAVAHVRFARPDHGGLPDAYIGLEDDVEFTEGVNIAGAVDKMLNCRHCPVRRGSDWVYLTLQEPAHLPATEQLTLVEERIHRLEPERRGAPEGAYGFVLRITPDAGRYRALVEFMHEHFDEWPVDWAMVVGLRTLGHYSLWRMKHGIVGHRGRVSTYTGVRENTKWDMGPPFPPVAPPGGNDRQEDW